MLYFSELDKIKVWTNHKELGYLEDLIFSAQRHPYITKLVIRSRYVFDVFKTSPKQKLLTVPIEYIERVISGKIIVKAHFKQSTIQENELFVRKNLLDTQVIDIEENNIVRVNDVLIQSANGKGFIIYGVDIGGSGILRWFKLEKPLNKYLHIFKKSIPQSTLAWSDLQPLELSRGRVVVNRRFDQLKKLHPADLADYLETQNFKNVMTLIEGIDRDQLAQVISELNPNFQMSLLKRMSVGKIIYILSIMDPDDAVDVISQFSKKRAEIIFKRLPEEEASDLRRLLELSVTPLGQFLNTHFLIVFSEETAGDVTKKVKETTPEFALLDYVYVKNNVGQLIGVFNLHELLLQDFDVPVFRFMNQHVISASLTTPVEIAFRRLIKYRLNLLPVIDRKKRIIGLVSIDDIGEEMLTKMKLYD